MPHGLKHTGARMLRVSRLRNGSRGQNFDEHGRYSGVSPLSVGKFKDESGFVAVYIDDLIVFSQSAEDHKRHLLHLLDILSKERLYLNNEKSHYFCKYTRYLGAVCGNGVLLMCPEKIRSIVDMPVHKNTTSQTKC